MMNKLTKTSLHKWADIKPITLSEHVSQQLVWGNDMMLSQLTLKKGAVVEKHAHSNEQFTCILKGALEFSLGEDQASKVVVSQGEVLHIPANLPHSALALADTIDLDIFTPPRAEWLAEGGRNYFKPAQNIPANKKAP